MSNASQSLEAPRVRAPQEIDAWHLENAARLFACGSDWQSYLFNRLGTRQWVVATRLTDRLRAKGYDVAVTQKQFTRLELDFGMPRLRQAIRAYPLVREFGAPPVSESFAA